MTEADLIALLRTAAANAGGQKAWAIAHGVSPQYVNDIILGRRQLSETVAHALGYRVQRIFTPLEEAPDQFSYSVDAIMEALDCSISDIATMTGVTRQAVYDWKSGKTLSRENFSRLCGLSRAAEVFASSNIKPGSRSLNRALSGGGSFISLIAAGGDAIAAARRLVEVLAREAEQREKLSKRLAGRTYDAYDAGVSMLDD